MTEHLLQEQLDELRSIHISFLEQFNKIDNSQDLHKISLAIQSLTFLLILIVSILYILTTCRIGRRENNLSRNVAREDHPRLIEEDPLQDV